VIFAGFASGFERKRRYWSEKSRPTSPGRRMENLIADPSMSQRGFWGDRAIQSCSAVIWLSVWRVDWAMIGVVLCSETGSAVDSSVG
jgi:hypothetical protein